MADWNGKRPGQAEASTTTRFAATATTQGQRYEQNQRKMTETSCQILCDGQRKRMHVMHEAAGTDPPCPSRTCRRGHGERRRDAQVWASHQISVRSGRLARGRPRPEATCGNAKDKACGKFVKDVRDIAGSAVHSGPRTAIKTASTPLEQIALLSTRDAIRLMESIAKAFRLEACKAGAETVTACSTAWGELKGRRRDRAARHSSGDMSGQHGKGHIGSPRRQRQAWRRHRTAAGTGQA